MNTPRRDHEHPGLFHMGVACPKEGQLGCPEYRDGKFSGRYFSLLFFFLAAGFGLWSSFIDSLVGYDRGKLGVFRFCFRQGNEWAIKKKQRPIQRRKVLNLCTIFRLAKPAFFRYNGKLHWKGFICSDCAILLNTGNTLLGN